MSRIIRYLLCLLSFFILQQTARAQQFPVSASTQIIPPYSVYLPDYAVPGSDKLRVILVQNDLTRPSYDVRLQMIVERNGTVIMRTAPSFTPKPLTLSPGVPTIIGGTELYDYLNSVNIEFSGGFSRDEYERTKSLPEGAYRVSFTAYDYRRSQVQVSNVGANVFFFQKSDPPLLNLPICGSRVEKRDPQFMNFNWSTRNSPNPLPGSGTEYVFSLYEIKPAGSNPDYILRTARPIYTITTESNTLVYGPGEPLLIDSMQYVWTVQARDKSGRDLFSNQGLSKSCTFTYLGNNPFAQFNIGKPTLSGRSNGQRSIRLSWPLAPADAAYTVEAYRLQYRATKKDGVEFDWLTEEKQKDTAFTVNSLEPGRSYEARLQWRVAGVYGAYSDLVTIKTDTLKPFVCGDATPVNQTTNNTPLAAAKITDIVRIGHFDVLLTQVSGGNGSFSGVGRVITPGFGIGLKMEFKNITINSDMLVTKGEMYAATEGIDKFVKDKLDEQRGGNDVGQVVTGDIVPDIKTNLYIFSAEDIKVDTTAKTITLTNSQSGQQEVINYKDKGKTLPLVLEDAGGNLYNIDKNGKVTSAGRRDSSLAGNAAALAALNTLQLDKGEVTFSVPSGSKYAFDAWKDSYAGKPVLDSSYELLANGKYRVSAKATQSGVQDVVIATLKNAAAGVADSLKFVSGKGIFYPFSRNGDTYTITITGGPAGDAQEVYAVFSKTGGGYTSIGKLLVASYATLQKKVVLIPIGASTTVPVSAIESSLKSAYEKIGVVYTVEVDESFRSDLSWDDNGDKVLQDSKSAFLSNGFTGEEKAMKKAYKKSHDIDNNTVYLFVVNEAALSDGDLLGKMPRQSQFGFIFTKGASTDKVGRTVAHEIGHGDYTLEHTFSAGIGLPKATTENLMDYNSGYELLKYQWNIVHDPGSVWGIFEDDGESTLFYNNYFLIKDRLLKDVPDADYLDNDSINYVVPDGRIIRLGKDFKVSFGGYLVVKGTANASGMSKDAIGVITGFNKGDTYWSCLFSSDGTFLGYFSNGSTRTKYEFKEQTGERLIVAGVEFSKCQLAIYSGIYQAKAVKYTAFDEIPFKDNNRKLIGVKSIEGKECVECTLKLENKPADVQNVLKEYYVNPKSSRLDDLMENVSEQNMKNFLCVDERFELIRNISDGFVVGDDDEMSIIKLIRSTPDDQVKDMLSRFDKDSTGLLATIFSSIDGDELTEYFSAMSQLFIRSKSAIEWATIYNEFDLAAGKVQYSMDSRDCNFWYEMARQAKVFVTHAYNGEGVNTIHYTLPMEAPIYDQYGRVAASFRDNNCTLNILHQTFRTRPFELIRLLSYTKEGNITDTYAPALFLGYITNNYKNFDINVALNKLIVTLAAKQLGTKGATFWTYLWATADLIVASGNLYILNEQEALSKTESGKAFIEKWHTVNKYLAIGQGARLLYGLAEVRVPYKISIQELKAAYNEWKASDLETLRKTNPELAEKLEAFGLKGIGELENLLAAAELQAQKQALDAVQIGERSVALGEDLGKATSWMSKGADGDFFYIMVHGEGNVYKVLHKGVDIEIPHNSLARWIEEQNISAESKLVLVSCANLESAQALSKTLNRPLAASPGLVRLYDNGAIEAEGGFKWLDPKAAVSDAQAIKVSREIAVGEDFIELGSKIKTTVLADGVVEITQGSKVMARYAKGKFFELFNMKKPIFGGSSIELYEGTTTVTGVLEDVNTVYFSRWKKILGDATAMGERKGGINMLRSDQWIATQNKYEYLRAADKLTIETQNFVAKGLDAKAAEAAATKLLDGRFWKAVTEEFWIKVNKPWMEEAIKRGDRFRFVSDPNLISNLKRFENGVPQLNEFGEEIRTIYSLELDLLRENGYVIPRTGNTWTAIKK